jgi:hypothetical protein
VRREDRVPKKILDEHPGAAGNLARREKDGWMMSPRIWKCLDFELGGGWPSIGKYERRL